jgi:hypothetical protein
MRVEKVTVITVDPDGKWLYRVARAIGRTHHDGIHACNVRRRSRVRAAPRADADSKGLSFGPNWTEVI